MTDGRNYNVAGTPLASMTWRRELRAVRFRFRGGSLGERILFLQDLEVAAAAERNRLIGEAQNKKNNS